MSSPALEYDIGAYLNANSGINPVSQAAGAANGAGVDRVGFNSCVLHVMNGAASGSPTSFSVVGKLQHSSVSTAGWADLSTDATEITTPTSTAADNSVFKNINLSGAKKYIRAVVTASFVGGTSPEVVVACSLMIGGKVEKPQVE